MTSKAVCIITFGCQMNKLDSELVAETLTAAGHRLVGTEEEAEVILFNTCSVRDRAEQKVLSRIGHLKARKAVEPRLLIGLMGCFAQREGAALRDRLPHLDLICGTRMFPRIAEFIEQAESGPVIAIEETSLTAPGTQGAHGRPLHTGVQAFLSVMRGCNNFCAYCIVPYVRGREESRPVAAVVEEARILLDRGARELTLLGQNIDAYGKDIGSDLAELLEAVHELPGLVRLRFVTSHPRDIGARLVRTMAALPKVCNYLHMPAQSGSTPILQAMRRGYTREQYDEKLAMIQELAPGTLVTSDFIVGFPGETERDFARTVELVTAARFQNSYIFKYSPRPGTQAARELLDEIPDEVKKERNQRLLAAQQAVNQDRMASLVGTEQELFVEGLSNRDKTKLTGRTATNLIGVFPAPEHPERLLGELVTIEVKRATPLTLFGERSR